MLPGLIFVVALQLTPQLVPLGVALSHLRDRGQIIHNGIDFVLDRPLQIAIDLFPGSPLEHGGEFHHLLLQRRAVHRDPTEGDSQILKRSVALLSKLLVGDVLLLIEVVHLISENRIGEL